MKTGQVLETLKMDMIADLIKLLRIPSVLEEPQKNKPFGLGIDLALDEILSVAEKIGMSIYKDPNGYYGYAEIGKGETLVGILGHIDVVPEGDVQNWQYPPFDAVIDNHRIYGRGAQDDKGPMITVLYAIKALMDMKEPFNKRIRVIFGTDEENMWRGIKRYMAEQEVPQYAFTPDSTFPVIYAEKGLLQCTIKSQQKFAGRITGGTALNAVPESAYYEGRSIDKLKGSLKKKGIEFIDESSGLLLVGKSAHASTPELGKNAILALVNNLYELGVHSDLIDFLNEKIGYTHHGEILFGNCSDAVSGKLTINVGNIDINEEEGKIYLDIRIPVTAEKTFIEEGLKRVCEKYNLKYEYFDSLKAVHLPKDHPLIIALSSAYEEVTGLDSKPLSIGGATYARSMDNCVAFGAGFPGKEKLAHQANENLSIPLMLKSAEIYVVALRKLLKN